MTLRFLDPAEETATATDRFGEAAFVRIIKQVASEPPSPELWKQAVAQIIVATTSHAVRNAAAVALVDLKGHDFADALIEVIRRPDLARHNGTLIYALDELGASMPLELLVQIIEQGSYEGTAEALLFLQDDRIAVPHDRLSLEHLKTKLHDLVSSNSLNVGEAAADALSHLNRSV